MPIRDATSTVPPERVIAFSKTDAKLRIAYAEVYAPGVPDSQGDVMKADEIRKMAHGFLQNGFTKSIDVEHDQNNSGAVMVESFIARKGDPDFIEGSWVAGVQFTPELWEKVEKGEINGFSMDGEGYRTQTVVKLEVPDQLTGQTTETQSHTHRFIAKYDAEGNFLGGETDVVNNHFHVIERGTVTELAGGNPHNHRFSFVEAIHAHP